MVYNQLVVERTHQGRYIVRTSIFQSGRAFSGREEVTEYLRSFKGKAIRNLIKHPPVFRGFEEHKQAGDEIRAVYNILLERFRPF